MTSGPAVRKVVVAEWASWKVEADMVAGIADTRIEAAEEEEIVLDSSAAATELADAGIVVGSRVEAVVEIEIDTQVEALETLGMESDTGFERMAAPVTVDCQLAILHVSHERLPENADRCFVACRTGN